MSEINIKNASNNNSESASKFNSDMLVKELIESIENGRISIKEIASFFESSDRTIQKKISNLGYKWDAKAMKYYHDADDTLGNIGLESLTAKEVFEKKPINRTIKKASTNNIEKENKNSTKDNSNSNINNKIKNTSENDSKNDIEIETSGDRIDELLSGKKLKKKYIGFYADRDVSLALDKIEGRIKSELINECIRIVLKDKGFM